MVLVACSSKYWDFHVPHTNHLANKSNELSPWWKGSLRVSRHPGHKAPSNDCSLDGTFFGVTDDHSIWIHKCGVSSLAPRTSNVLKLWQGPSLATNRTCGENHRFLLSRIRWASWISIPGIENHGKSPDNRSIPSLSFTFLYYSFQRSSFHISRYHAKQVEKDRLVAACPPNAMHIQYSSQLDSVKGQTNFLGSLGS